MFLHLFWSFVFHFNLISLNLDINRFTVYYFGIKRPVCHVTHVMAQCFNVKYNHISILILNDLDIF